MDVERTIEFILQQHARTEAIMQRMSERDDQLAEGQRTLAEGQRTLAESHQRFQAGLERLEETEVRLAENLVSLTDIVRQFAERNQREHEQFKEFHRGVDERFDVLIKMMDEWIREQRNRNGGR